MKTYHIEKPGSIDGLALRRDSRRQSGPSEVLVCMHATSLNYRDLLIALGKYLAPGLLNDVIPLSDGAGEVAAVGTGVFRLKVGERVATNFHQRWIDGTLLPHYIGSDLAGSMNGLLAEAIVLNENGVVARPRFCPMRKVQHLDVQASQLGPR